MDKSQQQINDEWENLPLPPSSSCLSNTERYYKSALSNRHLNRYQDVLPFESTRVKLSTPTSYINASYIEMSEDFKCIAAQAPLPQAFNDFWQMVWESGVVVIVMLSRFIEKRRVKAHCYWPSLIGQPDTFDKITVTLNKTQNPSNGITIQHFTISDDFETRKLVHVHYTNWPDYGVPETTEDIREIKRIAELYATKESLKNNSERDTLSTKSPQTLRYPILVHCSAGIGRAGTFLAFLNYCQLIKQGQTHLSLSVGTIVSSLRKQRMCMVQTKEQYHFIYQLLNDEFGLNYPFSGTKSKIPPPLRSSRSYCINRPKNFLRTTQTNLCISNSFSIPSS